MSDKIRVRFAPSPTGPLHIGGVRTALFNYLFAKKYDGDFILRIEDTDQSRYVPGAEAYIVEALDWLNIPFEEGPGREGDFGPYRQSERKAIYEKYANALIKSGNAYYAFDTSDELAQLRKEQESKGGAFIYNWHNRHNLKNSLALPEKEVESKLSSGEQFVIRFKSPQDETLELADIIRGNIHIDTNNLDDKVLFKSDGMPTYHLANIVDDHLMGITHVIRGEEWLPSLPLHKMLYKAFEWEAPIFAHLPLIMKPTGKGKLSKRDGDKMGFPVFPLEWTAKDGSQSSGYREEGYLPEAVVNFLALLGWNPGSEQEIFSLDELVSAFDLAKVNKAGAKFDPEKTKWFQQHYFQQLDNAVVAEYFSELIKEKGIKTSLDLIAISKLLKERASFISDLWEQGSFFFIEPQKYEAKASKKAFKEDTAELLTTVIDILKEAEDFSAAFISFKVKEWITKQGIGFGTVMMPFRLALVGEMKGPDVFEIASILGKEKTVKRILSVISFLD
jgi:glutamyl-tRNA synthetase